LHLNLILELALISMVPYHTHVQIGFDYNANSVCHFDSVGELVGIYQVKNKTRHRDFGEYAPRLAAYSFGLLFADCF